MSVVRNSHQVKASSSRQQAEGGGVESVVRRACKACFDVRHELRCALGVMSRSLDT
jgi:hypothetical protein